MRLFWPTNQQTNVFCSSHVCRFCNTFPPLRRTFPNFGCEKKMNPEGVFQLALPESTAFTSTSILMSINFDFDFELGRRPRPPSSLHHATAVWRCPSDSAVIPPSENRLRPTLPRPNEERFELGRRPRPPFVSAPRHGGVAVSVRLGSDPCAALHLRSNRARTRHLLRCKTRDSGSTHASVFLMSIWRMRVSVILASCARQRRDMLQVCQRNAEDLVLTWVHMAGSKGSKGFDL